ncbi:Fanconi anemia group E protein [Gastrophryne carolinensis]
MTSASLHDPDKAGCLLLQALSSEQRGLVAAHRVLQSFPGPFPWMSIIEKLCLKVPVLVGPNGTMILKPKFAMLPLQTQRNLFRLLNFLLYRLPGPGIELLAATIREEPDSCDAWLLYLKQQFLTGVPAHVPSAGVMNNLHLLCKQLMKPPCEHSKLGWFTNGVSTQDEHGHLQSETLQEDKEVCLINDCDQEVSTDTQSSCMPHDTSMEVEKATNEMPALPPSIKARAPKLNQFLYQNMENETMDEDFLKEMNTIRELCSPVQLQALMSSVGVSHISPKCLLQLCIHLDYLSPDLSYAHASSLSTSLFLDRVLSLTTPAPRALTTALSVFCNKYAHPVCSTLIGPILDQAEPGSVHADFICRMISECLQPQQLHLCLGPILDASSTEVAIIVLHLLIEKKDKFCQSEFEPLLSYLCHLAEKFSKSVTFSKLLLVLLTSKPNLIQVSHFGLLSAAVNSNQTFMKKSLQNALKKITGNV